MNQKSLKLWNSIGFPLKHFMLRFSNLPFELFFPSRKFSRKPFTLEFVKLLLERSSEIIISFSFKSIWKILSWIFSLLSLYLSISLQISCSSLRLSNISSSSLCKSYIFSLRVLFTGSSLWTLPSSNKQLAELIILVTKPWWPTLWLMVFWLATTPLLTNQDGTKWRWNTGCKYCQTDVN